MVLGGAGASDLAASIDAIERPVRQARPHGSIRRTRASQGAEDEET